MTGNIIWYFYRRILFVLIVKLTIEGGIKSCLHSKEKINILWDIGSLLRAMYSKHLEYRLSKDGKAEAIRKCFR